MPKLKIEEAGSISMYERQKLQNCIRKLLLLTVLYWTWQKLADYQYQRRDTFYIQRLLVQSLLGQHEKSREWELLLDFALWIWFMDLAHVEKMEKENNGVKILLFRHDLFDRTVNAKGRKTKDSQETVKAFSSMITRKKRPENVWVDKGTEFAGAPKKFSAAEGIQVHSTMSETKAAFADRTIRSSKIILYRYIEDYGYKYLHKLPQFSTTLNSRRNISIDMRPNTVNNMSIFYSIPSREYKNSIFKSGDRVRISRYDLPFRKGYKPQLEGKFLKLLQSQQENQQHTQSRMSKKRLFKASFIEKNRLKSFNKEFFTKELFSNASGELFPDNTLRSPTNFLPEQVCLEEQLGGWNFRTVLPINVPNNYRRNFQVFWRETLKIYDNLPSRFWSMFFHHRYCGSHEYAQSGEKQPQRKLHN